MKYICFLFLIPLLLTARENPFFPVNNEQDIPLTTNQIEKTPPLNRATIKLPSTARTIETVIVKYKNLDGSISTKQIQLNNSIDWHLPLFISQNYCEKSKKATSHQTKKNLKYTKVLALPFISFYASGKNIKIVTQDKLLRNFLLVKPHRIVCDFKRQTEIGSYIKKISLPSYFKKIRIGTHKGYYRVVIELDGYYRYKLQKTGSGYLFRLL